jgi:hypothetical protein
MKANLFLTAILLLLVGCTVPQSEQLTQQQKDQIKAELKPVCDSIIACMEKLDPQGWLKYYADSPDWAMFGADGAQMDFQAFKKSSLEFPNAISSYKLLTTTRQDFIIVTKDDVICAWVGKDQLITKTGEIITYEQHPYTLIFKKIAGQWKVVYSHDSGAPTVQKASMK